MASKAVKIMILYQTKNFTCILIGGNFRSLSIKFYKVVPEDVMDTNCRDCISDGSDEGDLDFKLLQQYQLEISRRSTCILSLE